MTSRSSTSRSPGIGADADSHISVRALCWALLRSDGTIHLAEVADVGSELGLSEQTVRHGVRRLCDREGFTREGRGRHAVAHAGPHSTDLWDLDRELVRFAYRQDAGYEPWDGRWRLITFSIPETRRADRDRLRVWLRAMGGTAVSHATYVSPHDWWDVVRPAVEELDLIANVTWGELDRLVVAGMGEPTAIAAHLWPSTERDIAYAAALASIDEADRTWNQLDDSSRRRAWVAATVSITGPFDADPLLPNELAESSGRSTRKAYRALTERFLTDVDGADRYSVALEMAQPVTRAAPPRLDAP
jgi:phenylacetic acid degradation operon negative regulatory protein